MARKAVKQLLEKTGTDPLTVDAVVCSTSTGDYHFPSVASIVLGKCGMTNAHAFDFSAACSGFLFAMDHVACMIESGRYKKVVLIGADKMSSIVDYTDRQTCPIFGDGAAAVLMEPTTDEVGLIVSKPQNLNRCEILCVHVDCLFSAIHLDHVLSQPTTTQLSIIFYQSTLFHITLKFRSEERRVGKEC